MTLRGPRCMCNGAHRWGLLSVVAVFEQAIGARNRGVLSTCAKGHRGAIADHLREPFPGRSWRNLEQNLVCSALKSVEAWRE